MWQANFVTQFVWKQRDSIDQSLRCGTERGKKWSLVPVSPLLLSVYHCLLQVRWDRSKPATVDNLLLLSDPAATEHLAVHSTPSTLPICNALRQDTTATGSLPSAMLSTGDCCCPQPCLAQVIAALCVCLMLCAGRRHPGALRTDLGAVGSSEAAAAADSSG